jgi:hypothetical protein
MSGYQYWLGTTANRGFWQYTEAYTSFTATDIPDGSTIQVCSRGNLPYREWDGFNTRSIAHAAPTYDFNFGAEFTYGDWTCVQQILDMRYANNTVRIGHHYGASGRQNPGQLWPPGTPGVIPAA